MVTSTDADGPAGDESDSLELITGAGTEEERDGPERRTLILGGPRPETEAPPSDDPSPASSVPHEDLYLGDGDEIDLIDGVDPEPVYQPALIDTEDELMVYEAPGPDVEPDVVEVEDTLMAVDDYGDVP